MSVPVQFDIGCRDMAKSVQFYQKLGFKKVVLESLYVEITDGCIQIRLKRYSHPAIKLVYFTENLEERAQFLTQQQISFEWRKGSEEEIVCMDPNGCKISFSKRSPYHNPFLVDQPFTNTGSFFELSLVTNDIDKTIDFWKQLHFSVMEQTDDFCRCSDGTHQLAIYFGEEEPNTGLTFCEPDMEHRIPKISTLGIPFMKTDQTLQSLTLHGVSKTPEGQYIYLTSK